MMRAKAWACGLAAVFCAAWSWADEGDRDDETIVIIEREELEQLHRDTAEASREIAVAIREALEEAREEMRRVGADTRVERNRIREEAIRIRIENHDELRETLRDVMHESREVLHDAGEAMREFMAQGLPTLSGIGPILGFEPFFGDSGAGNARPVDERKSAAGVGEVDIENVAGRIVVEGWDQDEIHVQGTIGEDVEELVFEVDGSTAEVRVRVPKSGRNLKIRSELTIRVPKRVSVEAQTVSGGVEARNLEGSYLDLEAVSGGVKVAGCTGDIEASSTSGGIDIADARGEVQAECVSGSIEIVGTPTSVSAEGVSGSVQINGVQREAEVNSVSGRISVIGGALERFESESVSGGVTFEGGIARNGHFDISSVSGGVGLTFTSDVSAEFDVESFSGGITIDLPGAPTSAKRQVSFRTGDGSGRIDIESFSGGVRIDRK